MRGLIAECHKLCLVFKWHITKGLALGVYAKCTAGPSQDSRHALPQRQVLLGVCAFADVAVHLQM